MTTPSRPPVDFTGSVAVDPAEEERGHALMLQLSADAPDALTQLSFGLGSPSWRVRKTALACIPRFAARPQLTQTLIAGLAEQDNAGLRNACAEALTMLGQAAVAELTTALNTADLDQRKFVVEALGSIGTPAAQQALFAALEQNDSNVRAAVVDALGRIGGSDVVEHLTRRLQSAENDLQLLVYVLDALARCEACLHPGILAPLLRHRSLLRFVYPLLGLSGDRTAMGPLVAGMCNASAGNRRVATLAMARLLRDLHGGEDVDLSAWRNEATVLMTLQQALQDDDETVVRAGLYLLGAYGHAAVAPRILETGAVRGLIQPALEAAVALGRAVIAPLMASIDQADVQSQLLFLDVIEAMADARVVPELLTLMQAENAHLSGAAVRVLGRLGAEDVIAPLMNLVRRRDEPEITRQVIFALRNVGERHADAVATQMRRAIAAGDVDAGWLSVLGALGRSADLDVVAAACGHLDAEVRRAALEAAVTYGSQLPETTLLSALRDEQPRCRVAAARVAGAYPSTKVTNALLDLLHDVDPWAVAEAARSLGTVGARGAVAALQGVVGSPLAPIAIAALQSLSRLGAPHFDETLRRALQHDDPEVAREAVAQLGHVKAELAQEVLQKGLKHRAWGVRWAAAEQAASLRAVIPREFLLQSLAAETEPLVRDKLNRLLSLSPPA